MYKCPKCGFENSQGSRFCENCGNVLQSDNSSTKKSGNAGLIAAIILLCLLIVTIIVGAIFIFGNNSAEPVVQPQVESFAADNVSKAVNDYITTYVGHNSIAVAILDNKTSTMICSNNSKDIYSSWGCYYPVYLAYSRLNGYYPNTLNNILSSDAATCNYAANTAMNHMGGVSSTTSYIYSLYNCNSTSYGRYFGDVTSKTDNYTNAEDAVKLLGEFNKSFPASALCYNMSTFGIVPPNGANVYCQLGSENISKRVNLNMYAIVKGYNSDYCVAILTRNSMGKQHISQLLSVIHSNMEELSK